MSSGRRNFDAIVIGGGFYGMRLALFLRQAGREVLLVEREATLMSRASFANQARVHNGYHYPRSVLTAIRSRVNFMRFVREFEDCITREGSAYYCVARKRSKLTATQFRTFCARIGAPIRPASADVSSLFDSQHVESVFEVREFAFDAVRLRDLLIGAVMDAGVEVWCQAQADSVAMGGAGLSVVITGPDSETVVHAKEVFQCTYSGTNSLMKRSKLPTVSLTHELAEIALVRVPPELQSRSITVVDGPFFSIVPFPSTPYHSFTHVRYTPHAEWNDAGTDAGSDPNATGGRRVSGFEYMQRDAKQYLPLAARCEYVKSLWEVKTILPRSAGDDSRPILLRRNHGLPGLSCVIGGKIDNIYDVLAEFGGPSEVRNATG